MIIAEDQMPVVNVEIHTDKDTNMSNAIVLNAIKANVSRIELGAGYPIKEGILDAKGWAFLQKVMDHILYNFQHYPQLVKKAEEKLKTSPLFADFPTKEGEQVIGVIDFLKKVKPFCTIISKDTDGLHFPVDKVRNVQRMCEGNFFGTKAKSAAIRTQFQSNRNVPFANIQGDGLVVEDVLTDAHRRTFIMLSHLLGVVDTSVFESLGKPLFPKEFVLNFEGSLDEETFVGVVNSKDHIEDSKNETLLLSQDEFTDRLKGLQYEPTALAFLVKAKGNPAKLNIHKNIVMEGMRSGLLVGNTSIPLLPEDSDRIYKLSIKANEGKERGSCTKDTFNSLVKGLVTPLMNAAGAKKGKGPEVMKSLCHMVLSPVEGLDDNDRHYRNRLVEIRCGVNLSEGASMSVEYRELFSAYANSVDFKTFSE